MKRGLLTKRDREVLLGKADDLDDISKRQNEIRHEVRQRRNNLIEDLEVLQKAGEDELLNSILVALSDVGQEEIREQLNKIEAELSNLEENYRKLDRLRSQVDGIKRQMDAVRT